MSAISKRYQDAVKLTEGNAEAAAILVLASVLQDLDSNLQDHVNEIDGSLGNICGMIEHAANNR